LIVATFVLDFLCVHPFRGGNGRVSRLSTSLLLQSHGFQVARYISLERLIEESKEEYYRVLKLCSEGWHEGKNQIVPWWNYFLSMLRSGYKEFERQVESVEARPAKSDLVRQTVLAQMEPFTFGRHGGAVACSQSAAHQEGAGGDETGRPGSVDGPRARRNLEEYPAPPR
jgi:Fic/DOC family